MKQSSNFDRAKGESLRGVRNCQGRGRNGQGRGRGRNNFQKDGCEATTQPKCRICKRSSHDEIVGSRANLNVSIARNLGIFKKIVDSTTINKQTLPKSKKAKKVCSMIANPHPSTRMMYGSLIVDVAIT